MAVHVKEGDIVEVIAGDHRGARGKVLTVSPGRGKVVVEGINRVYRHVRPSTQNPQGGRVQVEQALDISNVMPIHPKTDRPTRVRFVTAENGQKSRVALDGTSIDIIRKARS